MGGQRSGVNVTVTLSSCGCNIKGMRCRGFSLFEEHWFWRIFFSKKGPCYLISVYGSFISCPSNPTLLRNLCTINLLDELSPLLWSFHSYERYNFSKLRFRVPRFQIGWPYDFAPPTCAAEVKSNLPTSMGLPYSVTVCHKTCDQWPWVSPAHYDSYWYSSFATS